MIRFAKDKDKPQLINIFRECFDDSEEYVDRFFDKLFPKTNKLVYETQGKIVSMLFLFEPTITIDQKERKLLYVYAGATLKRYRKKGYYSSLLNRVFELAAKNNFFGVTLIPENQSLIFFYERLSYNRFFAVKNAIIFDHEIPTIHKNICSEKNYTHEQINEIRNNFYNDNYYVKWTNDIIDFEMETLSKINGQLLTFTCNNHPCYAFCSPMTQSSVFIKELVAPYKYYEQVILYIHSVYNAKKYTIRLKSNDSFARGSIYDHAMIRFCENFVSLSGISPYFNLGMD